MKKKTVELFTEPANNTVMRVPGRAYPGVLVQGDSLRALYVTADLVWTLAVKSGDTVLIDEADGLRESLSEIIEKYEKALAENAISLPYSK